jgi:hypothetical protein
MEHNGSYAGRDTWDVAYTGSVCAYVNMYANGDSVSQTVNTVPGQAYHVDFWIASNHCCWGPSYLTVSFANTVGFAEWESDIATPANVFSEHDFITTATSSMSTFRFSGYMDWGTFFIDNVSVTPFPGPALNFQHSGSNLILIWTGSFILQTATDLSGPYTDVANAVSPYTASRTNPKRFFRLRSAI